MPLLIGLAVAMTGTSLICTGTNLAFWISGRVLAGAAFAFVHISGIALLVDTVGSEHLGEFLGYPSMGFAVGLGMGPLLGGVIYAKSGYYSVFFIMFALLGLDAVLRLLVIEKREAVKWGIPKGALEPTDCSPDPQSVQKVEATGPLNKDADAQLQGQLPREGCPRSAYPLLLSNPRILTSIWGYLMTAFLATSFDAVLPLFVEETFGWNQMGAGLIFLPMSLPICVDPLTGMICDKWPSCRRYMASGGLFISVPVLVCLRFVSEPDISQKVLLCILLSLIGLLISAIEIPSMLEVSAVVEEEERMYPGKFGKGGGIAQAYGLCISSFAVGSVCGPLCAGFIRDIAGWSTMAWALAVISGVSGIPILLLLGGPVWQQRSKGFS